MIRISPIRLIDEQNNQIGIVDVKESLARARAAGLDLVEVDPHSRPPVCRIMDYGKWKYAQRKKEQKSKSHRHETELKEIRIKTPKIGDHDLQIKVSAARSFLSRGDRVQFTLRFRGRELAHLDEGRRIFQQIKADLAEVSKVDQDFRYEGKRMTMTLAGMGATGGATPPKKSEPGKKPATPSAPKKPAQPQQAGSAQPAAAQQAGSTQQPAAQQAGSPAGLPQQAAPAQAIVPQTQQ